MDVDQESLGTAFGAVAASVRARWAGGGPTLVRRVACKVPGPRFAGWGFLWSRTAAIGVVSRPCVSGRYGHLARSGCDVLVVVDVWTESRPSGYKRPHDHVSRTVDSRFVDIPNAFEDHHLQGSSPSRTQKNN